MTIHSALLVNRRKFEEFQHFCVHESMKKNEMWNAEFGGFDLPRWSFSDEDQTLTFSGDSGPVVVCDVTMIGSTRGDSWQWSWGNKLADPRNREASLAIREFGEQNNWSVLSSLFLKADEHTGWECAGMGSHILDGQAVYRFAYGDDDCQFAYLVIRSTRRVNRGSSVK